jgi:uncharacterized protein
MCSTVFAFQGWRMRSLAASVLVALAAATASAATPLPVREDKSVYDVANIIDVASEAQLEALDAELMQKAGVAVVVVTVPRLEGETIDQLAVRVQHDWGVGRKATDESVVIALSLEDRKLFIATGYGAEGYLPDGKVGEIRDHATPQLKAADYSGGVLRIAQEVAAVAAKEHGVTLTGVPSVQQRGPQGTGCTGSMPTLIIFVVLLFLAFGRRRGGGGFGGGGGFWSGAVLGSMFGRNSGGSSGDGGGGGGFGGFGGGSGGGGGAGGDF